MATAIDIGANASSYSGNAGLGGGTLGVGKLDTQPLLDLAKYTMLYNRAEYDQRQKDAEFAAKEIADATSYDFTTSIPKDSKILQEKYDKLTKYIQENPDAVNYRDKKKWAEYKKMRNDLDEDLRMAKVRNTLYESRKEAIANQPDSELKKLWEQRLNDEVEKTDIRTPLQHSQKYDTKMPEIPKGAGVNFDVFIKLPNENLQRDYTIFDVRGAKNKGQVYEIGVSDINIDLTTPAGQEKAISRGNDFWLKGADTFNKVIASTVDEKGEIDKSKLDNTTLGVYELVESYNNYLNRTKADIVAGKYADKAGKPITFASGILREEDYTPINPKDGLSAAELAEVAQYTTWAGDTYKTKVSETDDAIQQAQIAEQRRNNDLDFKVAWKNAETARINATKPSGESGGAINSGSDQTALIFGKHINNIKEYFAKEKNPNGSMTVSFKGTDPVTAKALGLGEDEFVTYKKDGTAMVGTNEKGEGGRPMTIEQQKFNFLTTVKGGSKDEAQLDAKFVEEQEGGMISIFNTTNAQQIWDGWGKNTEQPKTESGDKKVKGKTGKEIYLPQ